MPALKILHLEDDDLDAELVEERLSAAFGHVEIIRARNGAEYLQHVGDTDLTLVLSDFKLPAYDGLEALTAARSADSERPFIFVSGAIGEDLAIDTLHRGATDYVLKDRMDRLPSAVRRAVALADERGRRKAAEAERDALLESERHARELAEAANRTKDEFLAVVSHELRTPLNAILGWGQLLTPDSGRELLLKGLTTIERNAKIQARLIEDILDMARVITGKLQLRVDTHQVSAFVANAVDAVRSAADAKNIEISLETAPGLTIVGDADRLQQVVWNLASNAVKFTKAGGSVKVAARRDNEELVISVTDNGRGIEPAFLSHVFERFRQGDATASRSHGGLGLGLAIVRHLVELHGGTVAAHSDGLGHGAHFEVRLPMRTKAAEALAGRTATPASGAPVTRRSAIDGIHVLVVEDEEDTRELVQLLLQRCGARVSTAASAQHGLELVKTRPDVIVSDIGMPEVDGYTFVRRLRQLDPADGGMIPAIALTAYTRELDRRQAEAAGYQRHISKPVQVQSLVTAIEELLPKFL